MTYSRKFNLEALRRIKSHHCGFQNCFPTHAARIIQQHTSADGRERSFVYPTLTSDRGLTESLLHHNCQLFSSAFPGHSAIVRLSPRLEFCCLSHAYFDEHSASSKEFHVGTHSVINQRQLKHAVVYSSENLFAFVNIVFVVFACRHSNSSQVHHCVSRPN